MLLYFIVYLLVFYHSDKPLYQEELAKKISILINEIPMDKSHIWIKSLFQVLSKKWENIDYHRMNKFLMLIRQIFIQILKYCSKNSSIEVV